MKIYICLHLHVCLCPLVLTHTHTNHTLTTHMYSQISINHTFTQHKAELNIVSLAIEKSNPFSSAPKYPAFLFDYFISTGEKNTDERADRQRGGHTDNEADTQTKRRTKEQTNRDRSTI